MGQEHSDISGVNQLLAEISGYYKHEIGMFEAALWQTVIAEFGEASVKRGLMEYVSSGATFMPKAGQIRERLGAGDASAALAFERIRLLVQRQGPYSEPTLDDAAAVATIQELGGWVELNSVMPDPNSDRFGFEALQKRFAALYTHNRSLALNGKLAPQLPLRSALTPLIEAAPATRAIGHEPDSSRADTPSPGM